jgi:hypothetical protein
VARAVSEGGRAEAPARRGRSACADQGGFTASIVVIVAFSVENSERYEEQDIEHDKDPHSEREIDPDAHP